MVERIMAVGVWINEIFSEFAADSIVVYTCQKPQPKRCKFFMWDDDAKNREKTAVLNNSRSEPAAHPPVTPKKRATGRTSPNTPSRYSNTSSDRTLDHEESFDWPSSEEDVFAEAASTLLPPETPRKAAKTVEFASPGKRNLTEMEADDVFTTPSTSDRRRGGLLSPEDTPAIVRKQEVGSSKDLVTEVLEALATTNLSSDVREKVVEVLNRHELRFQGIGRGRDISRVAIKAKDKQIAELQARISGLEAERDTSKLVIAHLKHDISSPKQKKT